MLVTLLLRLASIVLALLIGFAVPLLLLAVLIGVIEVGVVVLAAFAVAGVAVAALAVGLRVRKRAAAA